MTDVLGLLAYVLLPLIGIGIWRVESVRRMDVPGRIGIAMATGALIVAITMAAMSVVGIEWSRTSLFIAIAIGTAAVSVAGAAASRAADGVATRENATPAPKTSAVPLFGVAFLWLLTLYGTITARESCGDLQFTWGPKAIRWFRAGGLDPNVLHTWPQLTVDYPPLQTLLLSWSNTLSHQFSWWAAVLAAPLFFLATLAVFRTFSRDDLGTLLVAGTLTWTFTLAYPAGCAEPPLLLFETIAIAALTFLRDPRAQTFFASLGAAGAVFTKLEGTTFTIALVLTILIVQRNWRRALIVAAPAGALFGTWMSFVFYNDLLYMYGGARLPIYIEALPVVLKTLARVMRFELLWIPWVVPVLLLAAGNARRAAVPISMALLTMGATVYFYVHYPDPIWWIESSSPRVLLTPLLSLTIAGVAAWQSRLDAREATPDPVC